MWTNKIIEKNDMFFIDSSLVVYYSWHLEILWQYIRVPRTRKAKDGKTVFSESSVRDTKHTADLKKWLVAIY